ncbi:RepA protein [Frondihabitans sp. PhB188]|uniref:replication protein RepA n=1 Tax=Frondihabitans sp. PhB188 TaxID=2485200 RepID=UPI000F472E80|nr:replication protein RepA [Frondihabitans sp. PhB188]ROQ30895.1 RepA protein [Frondihabitans sp. PhB188]
MSDADDNTPGTELASRYEDIPIEPAGFGAVGSSAMPELTRGKVDRLNFAGNREVAEKIDYNVGFSARVWAQVTLPYNDPGDQSFWVRRNGPITLRVRPAAMSTPDGRDINAYPFGILPRHIMTWMASEAYRTNSPELELGASMNAFMEKLGVTAGGKNRARLRDQMQRVFGSQLSVEGIAFGEAGAGYGVAQKYFQIADEVQLWFSEREDLTMEGLWSSKVRLSTPFYDSIKAHPIPVDLDALRVLGSAPLRIDIYIWLGYRLWSLERATRIKWSDLYVQFGSQTKRERDFKIQFLKALLEIKIVFPALRYEYDQNFFVLFPGPTPVPTTTAKRALRS